MKRTIVIRRPDLHGSPVPDHPWIKDGIEWRRENLKPGLGTSLQKVIHRMIDASPLPERAKNSIKTCGGCRRRAERLNSAGEAMRKMIAGSLQPPKSHGP